MFSQAVVEKLDYYVYFLQDPRDSKVFYVGKGVGNRVFNHLDRAKENSTNLFFTKTVYDKYKELIKSGDGQLDTSALILQNKEE